MSYKYGIYQSTSKSCIFYKQDDDGKQSTFNVFIVPSKEKIGKNEIFAFIDNEQMKKDSWVTTKNFDIKEIIKAFGEWANEAPIVFEIEAEKSIGQCLNSVLKKC